MNEERITYLNKKVTEAKIDTEKNYRKEFNKQSQYMGNGVYSWNGLFSTNPRELFLMGVLLAENIAFKKA